MRSLSRDEIVERVISGDSIGAVAREAGVSRQRISQIIHKAGVRVDARWYDEQRRRGEQMRATVVALHAEGLLNREIADTLGVETGTVSAWLRRSGLAFNRSPFPHATDAGYQRGCRCDPCKQAQREARSERRQRLGMPARVHGTENGYRNYDCRCDRCRAAGSEGNRRYRQRRRQREVLA